MHGKARSGEGGRDMLRAWLALVGTLGGLWGLVWWVQQTPRPRGLDAPEPSFAEARAMAVVRKLADEIGPHPIGSAASRSAAEFLAAELRRMPRVEVEVQDAEGDNRLAVWTGVNFHYRVRNVVARLPGRRPEALLLNAHYDSPAEAPGGSDNGIGTAAMVETLRALAAGPMLEWTIVLNLNGGEEAGSVGAAGFLQHRFAKDVRAFIDTDGSGAGKAALIQVSGQVPALVRAYARAAPAPQASVLLNDIAQSGLLGQSGDFEPLTRASIPGLDFAALGDIWAVHTHLDVSSRLAPGTLQHLGDTILGVARELASTAPPLAAQSERTVYYDVLGQGLLTYSMTVARLLAAGALALLLLALWRLVRGTEVTVRQLAQSMGWTLLSALAGLAAALLAALLLVLVLKRPQGFFATPLLAVPTFLGSGLSGVLAVQALGRRRAVARGMSAEATAQAAWAGGLLWWGVLLSLCSLGSLGLGYLALWGVTASALALLGGSFVPRWRWELWLASVVVGMVGPLQLAVHLVPALVGISGMFPLPPPGEVKLAVLLWLLGVLPLALGGLAGVHRAGPLRASAGGWALIAAAGVLATALHSPYTAARPKRLQATHAQREGQAALLLLSLDDVPLAPVLTGVAEAQPLSEAEPWPNALLPSGWLPAYSHKLPASPLPTSPPRLEVVSRSEDPQNGTRTVKLRLQASGWMTSLDIPQQALAGWSLAEPLPQPAEGQPMITAVFYAPDPAGHELTLRLRGADPVEVTLRQNHAPEKTPELHELRRRLPAWTTINDSQLHVVKIRL